MQPAKIQLSESQYYKVCRYLCEKFDEEFDYQLQNDCDSSLCEEIYQLLCAIERPQAKKYPHMWNSINSILKEKFFKIQELELMKGEKE